MDLLEHDLVRTLLSFDGTHCLRPLLVLAAQVLELNRQTFGTALPPFESIALALDFLQPVVEEVDFCSRFTLQLGMFCDDRVVLTLKLDRMGCYVVRFCSVVVDGLGVLGLLSDASDASFISPSPLPTPPLAL